MNPLLTTILALLAVPIIAAIGLRIGQQLAGDPPRANPARQAVDALVIARAARTAVETTLLREAIASAMASAEERAAGSYPDMDKFEEDWQAWMEAQQNPPDPSRAREHPSTDAPGGGDG